MTTTEDPPRTGGASARHNPSVIRRLAGWARAQANGAGGLANGDPQAVDQAVAEIRALGRMTDPDASDYPAAITNYYRLITEILEAGWGTSFHNAPRFPDESPRESLLRFEYYLAMRMGVQAGMHVLDVGCGVGGPMRSVAKFADVDVTGITISDYQIQRATAHNAAAGLADRCHLVQGDFTDMAFGDATFDGAFTTGAMPHAPDRRKVFSEVFRVLRPGALFVGDDWGTTDRYDPTDAEHRNVIGTINETLTVRCLPFGAIEDAAREAGFEVVETRDMALDGNPETPWYLCITRDEGGVYGFRSSPTGRRVTRTVVSTMEWLKLASPGTRQVHALLETSAQAMIKGAQLGIFTPLYFFVLRKPEE